MRVTPAEVLSLLLFITAAAALLERARRRRRSRALRRLAGEWRMTYAAVDTLQITANVARHFPIPGAADVHVRDLIYGIEGGWYRYVFTAEFTTGVVRGKRRHVRVCAFSEPRDRHRPVTPGPVPGDAAEVVFAPAGGPLLDQYRRLAPARAEAPGARSSAGTASPPDRPGSIQTTSAASPAQALPREVAVDEPRV